MLHLVLAVLFAAGVSDTPHQRGLELYKQQKYAEAIPFLVEASKTESASTPEFRESVLLIGQSYFMLSQSAKAIPWLEQAPEANEANYMLGYAYYQAGEHDKSEAAFARLFGVKPESAAGHLVAAQMLIKKEFEQDAVVELNKALTLEPNLPEAHFLLAEVEILRGQLEDAMRDLRKEIAINPNFSKAWWRLGDTLTRQEKWDESVANLQRAIWLNQDFSGPYILLGKAYFKLKNYSNAEGILRRALLIDPQNTSATYLLAQTLTAEGKKEEAAALLQKVKAAKEEKPSGSQ